MQDAHRASTPSATVPVGICDYGGTTNLPRGQTRPAIAYAVHKWARYMHVPKNSHAVGVKRILRYLRGTQDKGKIFKPTQSNQINCHVDATFSGLFSVEDSQDLSPSNHVRDMLFSFLEYHCYGYQKCRVSLLCRRWNPNTFHSHNQCDT
jgi:hypothetical protein